MKSLKERTYEIEDAFFSPYACKSKDTSGREREETPCGMRTEFQRDRDRLSDGLKTRRRFFFLPKATTI